jgi:hypothetical protein
MQVSEHVHDRLAGGGQEHRRQAGGDADQQPAQQSARETADAADDDGDEARHQQACAHGGLETELTGGEHAAEPREEDAGGEIKRAQGAYVDAERSYRFQVERAGADADAQAAVAQQGEQPADGDDHHPHHKQPIAGDEKELVTQRLRQERRHRHRLALRAPDEARAVLEDKGEAEGEQQAVERVAAVQRPDQHALDDQADDGGQRRRDQQRAPEADIGRDRIGDVAADDEKATVCEIDDVAQIEDQRETERHEHVKGADDHAVGDVEQQQLQHEKLVVSGA